MVYVGSFQLREVVLIEEINSGKISTDTRFTFPYTEKPSRLLARRWLSGGDGTAESALHHIQNSINNRPLYAPSWLDKAEIHIRMGDFEEAARSIEKASSLWPNRRILLWRAAMLWMQLGQQKELIRTLRRYVESLPEHFSRAIVIAGRFETDPEKLLDELIPNNSQQNLPSNYFSEQALLYGIKIGNAALAEAAWKKIDQPSSVDKNIFSKYVGFLIYEKDDPARAASVFQDYAPDYQSGQVFNGGFENQISDFGLGWKFRSIEGSRWRMDDEVFYDGNQSLKITFDGSKNLNFRHFEQVFVVQPASRYRLTGAWKGKQVTTRSTPYLMLRSLNSENPVSETLQSPRLTWDWTPFSMEISVPKDGFFLRFQLRRNESDALDNKISGSMWLDNLHIELVEGSLHGD